MGVILSIQVVVVVVVVVAQASHNMIGYVSVLYVFDFIIHSLTMIGYYFIMVVSES